MAKNKFDELNEKGYVLIKGKPEKPVKDYELVKGNPPQLEPSYTKISKLGKALKGSGKVAAIGAAIGAAGSALAGEPVDWETIRKGAAEAINPLPFSREEINTEMQKMDYLKKIAQMQADKELERKLNEERARPGALEFGKYLKSLQKK